VLPPPKASNLDKARENAAAASIRLTATELATIDAAFPTVHNETARADAVVRSRRMSDSSGRFQSRQIDFPLLARKRDLSSAAARVLLNAGDAMVPRAIRQLESDFDEGPSVFPTWHAKADPVLLTKYFRFLRLKFFCTQNATIAKRREFF
jgi:hypothetical protein